jgi:hypothetical protein
VIVSQKYFLEKCIGPDGLELHAFFVPFEDFWRKNPARLDACRGQKLPRESVGQTLVETQDCSDAKETVIRVSETQA